MRRNDRTEYTETNEINARLLTCWCVRVAGRVQLVSRLERSERVVRATAEGGRVDDSRPHTINLDQMPAIVKVCHSEC